MQTIILTLNFKSQESTGCPFSHTCAYLGANPSPPVMASPLLFIPAAPNSQVDRTHHIRDPDSSFLLPLVAGSHWSPPQNPLHLPGMAWHGLAWPQLTLLRVHLVSLPCQKKEMVLDPQFPSHGGLFWNSTWSFWRFPSWVSWWLGAFGINSPGWLGTDRVCPTCCPKIVIFPNWAGPSCSFLTQVPLLRWSFGNATGPQRTLHLSVSWTKSGPFMS